MMDQLTAQKSVYDIDHCLGRGLTSEVYKAFRKDSAGFTRQTVALKLIKSRKDVQILQKEFENLSRVQSKYCVQVLAWENFGKGPALVLEYIDGVTLHQLWKSGTLGRLERIEILVHIRLGLASLHRYGVFHGDLNLKNIMITKQGLVKIIDFGFGHETEQCLTPEFADPRRLQGEPPTAETDWTSYCKLSRYLLGDIDRSEDRQPEIPRAWRRRRLAKKVIEVMQQTSTQTLRKSVNLPAQPRPRKTIRWGYALSLPLFVIFLLIPNPKSQLPDFHKLQVRSQNWFLFSINGGPYQYGPISSKMLRPGLYQLRWKMAVDEGVDTLKLNTSQTFLLKPDRNKL